MSTDSQNPHSFDVTTVEFNEKVIDASMTVPVVVDFWAEWCGPCKVLKPILEKLTTEYKGRFLLAKVDSDANPELAGHFGVRSIPTVVAVANGQIVDGFTGAKTEAQLREFLDRIAAPAVADDTPPPNPVEQARALRMAGDKVAAREILETTIAAGGDVAEAEVYLAKCCIEDGELDSAENILTGVAKRLSDDSSEFASRLQAMIGRVQLMRRNAETNADIGKLQAQLDAEPDNHALRLTLAEALAGTHQWRSAFEHLLVSIRKDKNWNEEAARKAMLNLFALLATDEEQQTLVREFRSKLAATLN